MRGRRRFGVCYSDDMYDDIFPGDAYDDISQLKRMLIFP